MLLSPGARLGPYEVLGPVGAGGMGEVYRARDTRLDRDVALKILSERVTGHPEALSRFEREAKAIAALSHPNILAVHDYGRDGGVTYVVTEILDGESLRAALANGALPVRKAVDYAVQAAHGVAAAHEKGIIHRDLKPENLFVTRDGRVKVLDFGLAAREPLAEQDLTSSPTLPRDTDPGVVLGTVGYMSPEQVRGGHVDHRSDVFALGCVLYEMLAGRRAFARPTAAETMSAILRDDIPEWPETGRQVPEALDRLVRRCLEKKPEERLQSSRDLALALELVPSERLSGGTGRLAAPGGLRPRMRLSAAMLLVALASSLASGVVAWRFASGRTRPSMTVRFTIDVESSGPRGGETSGAGGVAVGTIAICPDGSCVVFRATGQSQDRLLLRALDRNAPTALPGTEGGHSPFFSPDGQRLGFFADGRLKTIAIERLSVQTLCEAREGFGASWHAERGIFFSAGPTGPLLRVPVTGGRPEAATRLEAAAAETSHRWPVVLPGGAGLVYESVNASGQGRIVAQSLRTGERKVLFAGSYPRFAASGHLLYAAEDAVRAVPFDPDHLRVAGAPIEVIERSPWAQFDVSRNGTLAFVTRNRLPSGDRMLMRVDRSGHATPLADLRRAFRWPRLSPDGRRLAVSIRDAGRDDIWIYDLSRRALTRLTLSGRNAGAIWHPDGQRVTYQSDRAGPWNLFQEPVDGGGPVERLTTGAFAQFPSSWSSDGRLLSYAQVDPATGNDIWVLSASGEKAPTPFANSAFGEWDGFFSPDGRALAYTSGESGRLEVYVRPYPGPGGKRQVSTDGGNSPVWARTGKELFYLNGDRLMTASVRTAPQIVVGAPTLLFEGDYDFAGIVPNFDVTPDGTAFMMVRGERREPWLKINVVLNWFEELKKATERDRPQG